MIDHCDLRQLLEDLREDFGHLPRCVSPTLNTEIWFEEESFLEGLFDGRHWIDVIDWKEMWLLPDYIALLTIDTYLRLIPSILYLSTVYVCTPDSDRESHTLLTMQDAFEGSLFWEIEASTVRKLYSDSAGKALKDRIGKYVDMVQEMEGCELTWFRPQKVMWVDML